MQSALVNVVLEKRDETALEILGDIAVDSALLNGVLMRTAEDPNASDKVQFAPFLLFPSPIPKKLFDQAYAVQTDFNTLVHKIASDEEFLKKQLSSTIKADDFTRRLWDIFTRVRAEGISQPVQLGIHRSDYMIDISSTSDGSPSHRLTQIEINTIASSFGGLACNLLSVQKEVLSRARSVCGASSLDPSKIPDNQAMKSLASGFLTAFDIYRSQKPTTGENKLGILFVKEIVSRNIFDQRCLELEIYRQRSDAVVIRRTLAEIENEGELSEDSKVLTFNGLEIALAYFRVGYVPTDYPTEVEWKGRLKLERSRAIKCPSIAYHLVTTKKIQQSIAEEGALERFLDNRDSIARIRNTFTGLYPLDDSNPGKEAFEKAMKHPENFVLKPQREGGANNFYGQDIPKMLRQISDGDGGEKAAYILMDRIQPMPHLNVQLRPGAKIKVEEMVSELGIFGVFVGDGPKEYKNEVGGHLLRTKQSFNDEGGVAAGYAGIDSPYLI